MFYYPLSSLLIECLILSIVEREDSYGYEISQTGKLVANINALSDFKKVRAEWIPAYLQSGISGT